MIIILMGSEKDMPFSKKIGEFLDTFRIRHEYKVASAHKTPPKLLNIMQESEKIRSDLIYITVAGRSNALSGMVAANTIKPVIACPPLEEKDWMDIYSSLRMPSGVCPMTVIGPQNAALAAIKLLALTDKKLDTKISDYLKELKK